jgi:hypothetical protein
MPTAIEGILWGILPIGSSLLAILLAFMLPDRARARREVVFAFPSREQEPTLVPEAK